MTEEENETFLGRGDIAGERAQASGVLGAGAATTAAMQQDDQTHAPAEGQEGAVDYAAAGLAFTDWFNEKLRQLPNTQLRLGQKTAQAVRLHPDGRLECSLVASAGESEKTFVAFEGQHLAQLVRKIAALGV